MTKESRRKDTEALMRKAVKPAGEHGGAISEVVRGLRVRHGQLARWRDQVGKMMRRVEAARGLTGTRSSST
jgi:transposase-like protein